VDTDGTKSILTLISLNSLYNAEKEATRGMNEPENKPFKVTPFAAILLTERA
jgi:hypothetical protein